MSRSSQRAFHAQSRRSTADKRKRFVEEYVVDCNGAQAAERAGYSTKSAKVTASRLLTDANVQAQIRAKLEKKAERTELAADEVINGIRATIRRCEGEARHFNRSLC